MVSSHHSQLISWNHAVFLNFHQSRKSSKNLCGANFVFYTFQTVPENQPDMFPSLEYLFHSSTMTSENQFYRAKWTFFQSSSPKSTNELNKKSRIENYFFILVHKRAKHVNTRFYEHLRFHIFLVWASIRISEKLGFHQPSRRSFSSTFHQISILSAYSTSHGHSL